MEASVPGESLTIESEDLSQAMNPPSDTFTLPSSPGVLTTSALSSTKTSNSHSPRLNATNFVSSIYKVCVIASVHANLADS